MTPPIQTPWRTFRARTVAQQNRVQSANSRGRNGDSLLDGQWDPAGNDLIGRSWTNSPSQNNPQSVPASSGNKF
jgi:hypothetical protein